MVKENLMMEEKMAKMPKGAKHLQSVKCSAWFYVQNILSFPGVPQY